MTIRIELVESLFDQVSAALNVSGIVGIYYRASGGTPQRFPAIAWLPDKTHGMNYPPSDVTVSGLEVVFRPIDTLSTSMLLGGHQQDFSFAIVLKQWSGDSKLSEALDLILPLTDDFIVEGTTLVPASEVGNTIETLTLRMRILLAVG